MDVYKSEAAEIVKRFLERRISLSECTAALDAAIADLATRATREQLASLRPWISANREIVRKEAERPHSELLM